MKVSFKVSFGWTDSVIIMRAVSMCPSFALRVTCFDIKIVWIPVAFSGCLHFAQSKPRNTLVRSRPAPIALKIIAQMFKVWSCFIERNFLLILHCYTFSVAYFVGSSTVLSYFTHAQYTNAWMIRAVHVLQVIGKLPFEDGNHKKLLKLILAGPYFPVNRESSKDFQQLAVLILKREDSRIGIPEIRKSTWYTTNAFG